MVGLNLLFLYIYFYYTVCIVQEGQKGTCKGFVKIITSIPSTASLSESPLLKIGALEGATASWNAILCLGPSCTNSFKLHNPSGAFGIQV